MRFDCRQSSATFAPPRRPVRFYDADTGERVHRVFFYDDGDGIGLVGRYLDDPDRPLCLLRKDGELAEVWEPGRRLRPEPVPEAG